MPWGEWIELIRPHYYKGERGNKPYDLERMLRIYLVQNLYDLSDKATVAEVIDSRAFSEFCGVESSNHTHAMPAAAESFGSLKCCSTPST